MLKISFLTFYIQLFHFYLCSLSSPEYLPVTRQKTPEKPNFINLEGTGMLLNTLAKALCEFFVYSLFTLTCSQH